MIFTVDLIIEVHKRIIATSGGKDGIKDTALLDSAVSSIYQTYDSKELYPTLIEKAARLCFALNKNHPFIDGNKRVSMHMLASFLRFHDVNYAPTNDEVIKVGLSLADGSMSYQDLLTWLKKIT
jgi:death on curing protein